jgi:hypothetical protein
MPSSVKIDQHNTRAHIYTLTHKRHSGSKNMIVRKESGQKMDTILCTGRIHVQWLSYDVGSTTNCSLWALSETLIPLYSLKPYNELSVAT